MTTELDNDYLTTEEVFEGFPRLTIANALQLFRKKAGLTLKEAGQQLGVSAQYLSAVEKGNKVLSASALAAYSELYRCSLPLLLGLLLEDELYRAGYAYKVHLQQAG